MGERTGISWCHHTFNPWWGCTKVSSGCKNCYAERDSKRYGMDIWGPKGARRFFGDKHWAEPLAWDAKAKQSGERRRVFCASMADVFEGPETMRPEDWEEVSRQRERLNALIHDTPNLDWLILTKRPENIGKYGPQGYEWLREGCPDNVWIGTSCEDQQTADLRIPFLLKVKAAVRFLSIEPLLGPIDLHETQGQDIGCSCGIPALEGAGQHSPHCEIFKFPEGIDWVIVGGESGPNARAINPNWVRSLRSACSKAGIAFFFKQWGEWAPTGTLSTAEEARLALHRFEDGASCVKVGRVKAGHLLDGIDYAEFPTVKPPKAEEVSA